jgi:hypothetical protein
MITVFLRGGLGNQMFEYAAGLNLALKSKTELVLDTVYLHDRFPRRDFTYRTYDLDVFDIAPKFTGLSRISSAVPIPGVWFGLDLAEIAVKKALGSGRNSVLWGFYQGEKYFAENKEAVRAAFRFRSPLAGEAAELAQKIRQGNSISLHVRRGDYTLPKYEKLYGMTDMSYYERAIAHMAEHVSSPHFFVFSNDVSWCREHMKLPFPTVYADDASRGPKDSFHMELMSLCKHHIIANSSFSWWGAWLNRHPDKIVIAPKRWHADGTPGDDIVPASWIRI